MAAVEVLNNSQRNESEISTSRANRISSSGVSSTSSAGRSNGRATRNKKRGNFKSNSTSSRDSRKSGSQKNGRASIYEKNRSSSHRGDFIKVTCLKDVYYVNSKNFAECSNIIKKDRTTNTFPRSISLCKYDRVTAKVLVDFIDSKKVKTDISFYSLAELLKLAKVFEMTDLRNQLEKFVKVIAHKDLGALIQVLLIIGLAPVTPETETDILAEAAIKFRELSSSPAFQQIQCSVMIALFARCDLAVDNEVNLVDAMLLWLAGQPHQSTVVPSMFYLVRTDFLHPVQRAFILERARALRMNEDVVAAIARCFACKNGSRVCMMAEHKKARYPRCGLPDPSSKDAKEPAMPLSVPRDAIIYKPTKPLMSLPPEASVRTHASTQSRPFYHAPPACQKAEKQGKSLLGRRNKKTGSKKSPKKSGNSGSGKGKKMTSMLHRK